MSELDRFRIPRLLQKSSDYKLLVLVHFFHLCSGVGVRGPFLMQWSSTLTLVDFELAVHFHEALLLLFHLLLQLLLVLFTPTCPFCPQKASRIYELFATVFMCDVMKTSLSLATIFSHFPFLCVPCAPPQFNNLSRPTYTHSYSLHESVLNFPLVLLLYLGVWCTSPSHSLAPSNTLYFS